MLLLPPSPRRPVGVAVSAVVHAVVIAAAVTATARRGDTHPSPRHAVTLIYTVPPQPRAPRSPYTGAETGTPGRPETGGIPAPPIVEPGIPNLPTDPIGSWPSVDTTWEVGTRRGQPGPSEPPGPLTGTTVDVQAEPLPGAPSPQYPEMLRAAGIEGRVTLEFVVDTTGHAELASLHPIDSDAGDAATGAFIRAIRDALAATRYRPALVGGRPVRQIVRQPFVFTIAR